MNSIDPKPRAVAPIPHDSASPIGRRPDIAIFWFSRSFYGLTWRPLLANPPGVPIDGQFTVGIHILVMSTLRVAARRLPRASRLVPSVESPVQRRFAATSNVPQDVKKQAQVCRLALELSGSARTN